MPIRPAREVRDLEIEFKAAETAYAITVRDQGTGNSDKSSSPLPSSGLGHRHVQFAGQVADDVPSCCEY